VSNLWQNNHKVLNKINPPFLVGFFLEGVEHVVDSETSRRLATNYGEVLGGQRDQGPIIAF